MSDPRVIIEGITHVPPSACDRLSPENSRMSHVNQEVGWVCRLTVDS